MGSLAGLGLRIETPTDNDYIPLKGTIGLDLNSEYVKDPEMKSTSISSS